MIDYERPPVVIDDNPTTDPLAWLCWIVDNHPHVTKPGQVVFIDGTLLVRMLGDRPEPTFGTLAWSAWVVVHAAQITAADPVRPTYLIAVTPEGRQPFEAPVPEWQRLAESRTFTFGPDLRLLIDELRELSPCA